MEVLTVNNGAGVTTVPGDAGYIDASGDYVETTTANSHVAWCVVVRGGADSTDIQVARRGRVKVILNANCSIGNLVVTSTSAGKAGVSTVWRPDIFGICLTANAGGDGGTATVLLLTKRQRHYPSFSADIFRFQQHSGSTWDGTIAAVSGTSVEYSTTAGNEDWLVPKNTDAMGKMVLHNTTRSNSALIDNCSNTDTGTPASGTITLIANEPGDWAVTDVITVNSLTNTDTVGGFEFCDIDLNHADNTDIPANAVALFGEMTYQSDDEGDGQLIHPYETGDGSKRSGINAVKMNDDSTRLSLRRMCEIPIIDQKFTLTAKASSANGVLGIWRASGYVAAEP
ncbi:MAG: hypothetical protein GY861_03270 [bacterium]|nr:hypothetical protein [bacterium]